jgi:hypothetical protein
MRSLRRVFMETTLHEVREGRVIPLLFIVGIAMHEFEVGSVGGYIILFEELEYDFPNVPGIGASVDAAFDVFMMWRVELLLLKLC